MLFSVTKQPATEYTISFSVHTDSVLNGWSCDMCFQVRLTKVISETLLKRLSGWNYFSCNVVADDFSPLAFQSGIDVEAAVGSLFCFCYWESQITATEDKTWVYSAIWSVIETDHLPLHGWLRTTNQKEYHKIVWWKWGSEGAYVNAHGFIILYPLHSAVDIYFIMIRF